MGRYLNIRYFLLFSFIAVTLTSCSREIPIKEAELSVRVPAALSSLTTSFKLQHVVINMREDVNQVEATTVSFSYEQGGPESGASLRLVIPGEKVPRSSQLFIQYLGVYEGDGMRYNYGSTTVDSNLGGIISASITATTYGTSSEFGHIAGKYLPTSPPPYNGTYGPTGILRTYFAAPVAGHPDIKLAESEMIDGWFSTFGLKGVNFKYILTDSAGVNLNVFNTQRMLENFSSNASVIKAYVPKSYSVEKYSFGFSQVEEIGAKLHVVGFFNETLSASSNVTRYAPGARHVLQDRYIDPLIANVLVYDEAYVAPTPPALPIKAFRSGGTADANLGDYIIQLNLNNEWLSAPYGDASVIGVKAPFQAINFKSSYSNRAEYIHGYYDHNGGSPQIMLRWKILPGLVGDEVDGVDIYYASRFDVSNDFGGNDEDQVIPCNTMLESAGYNVIAADVTNQSYGVALASIIANYYDASFQICPYKGSGANKKHYANFASLDCLSGNCGQNDFHLGLADPEQTAMNVPAFWNLNQSSRVNNMTFEANGMTRISVDHAFAPTIETELLIRVVGMDAPGSCGNYGAQAIIDTQSVFVRAKKFNTYEWDIPRGTWIDGLITRPTNSLTNAILTVPSCYIVATVIPHLGPLNVSVPSIPNHFDFNTNIDGIIAFRSSGALIFSGTGKLDVSGKGYRGGISPNNGHGPRGLNGGGYSASNGGGGGGGGKSGGSGGGAGGNAGSFTVLSSVYNMSFYLTPQFFFGSGGGSVPGYTGGDGGGTIFAVMQKVDNLVNGAVFTANGLNGGASSPGGSGAGGGGSINIYAADITTGIGRYPLWLQAVGGMGGSGTTSGGGGGGGGVFTWLCESPLHPQVTPSNPFQYLHASAGTPAGIMPSFDIISGPGGSGSNPGGSGILTGDVPAFFSSCQ